MDQPIDELTLFFQRRRTASECVLASGLNWPRRLLWSNLVPDILAIRRSQSAVADLEHRQAAADRAVADLEGR